MSETMSKERLEQLKIQVESCIGPLTGWPADVRDLLHELAELRSENWKFKMGILTAIGFQYEVSTDETIARVADLQQQLASAQAKIADLKAGIKAYNDL